MGIVRLSSRGKGNSSINIAENAPKIIIDKGNVVFKISTEDTQPIIPANVPEIDLSFTL